MKRNLTPAKGNKPCLDDRTIEKILSELASANWITVTPDKKSSLKDDRHIKQAKKLKSYVGGHLIFYFSAARALIQNEIGKTAFSVYLALIRNLDDRKSVSYDVLAEDLQMQKQNIANYIRELEDAQLLIIQKALTETGRECNKYSIYSRELITESIKELEKQNTANELYMSLIV